MKEHWYGGDCRRCRHDVRVRGDSGRCRDRLCGPLTGGSAHHGVDLKQGMELTIEDANAKNLVIGRKPAYFALDAEDDQGDPRMGS
jgi:hypothetical protein